VGEEGGGGEGVVVGEDGVLRLEDSGVRLLFQEQQRQGDE
jgi:hypothetical protein